MDKIAYNAYEVSQLLGISKTTVYDLCRQGVIPSMQLGHRIVIPIKQFNLWLEKECI